MRISVLLLLCASCAAKSDAEYQTETVTSMHDALVSGINDLLAAAKAIQAAAPAPAPSGWMSASDPTQLDPTVNTQIETVIKPAWEQARTAYEHIEGALAPIFPNIDNSIDARYDDFMPGGAVGCGPDNDLFDDVCVTGMHAIERILYVKDTPARIVTFESTLQGYTPQAYPATQEQADEFKNKLCVKLIADAQTLHDQWTPQVIDIGGAFQGLVSLMNEQKEKVRKASNGTEESRYSQHTMRDVRDNLDGTKMIYAVFQAWLKSKKDGAAIDSAIEANFTALAGDYAQVSGDAIPTPPSDWQAEQGTAQSAADLATPFGKLFVAVFNQVDPLQQTSTVAQMNQAAGLLGFPQFEEQ
jgi:iron uptake system component EfeO